MSLAQHKFLSSALAALSLALLVLLLITLGRLHRYKVDVRYAHDIVGRFDYQRDLALKGELPKTIEHLIQLQLPEGRPSPFTGSLSNFVETQRRRALDDIIVVLRARTGKDFGDKPEAWIQEYSEK